MRVEHGVVRWTAHAGISVAVTTASILGVFLGVSCEHFRTGDAPPIVRAVPLEEDAALSVVMSRLGGLARRIVSSADSIQVGIHFDPEMIDVENVAKYVLWGRGAESSDWQRIEEIPAADLPATLRFKEGKVGLWASARYQDGEEVFIPGTGDEPVLSLVVDRSPPAITWLKPVQNAPVTTVPRVDLVWTIDEIEIGVEPSLLEWSTDGGQRWKPIATVEPQSGNQSYLWKPPPEFLGFCQVRLTARDLMGHVGSSVLTVEFVSAIQAGALTRGDSSANSAQAVPGVASESVGKAPVAGPTVDPELGAAASGANTAVGTLSSVDGPLTMPPSY